MKSFISLSLVALVGCHGSFADESPRDGSTDTHLGTDADDDRDASTDASEFDVGLDAFADTSSDTAADAATDTTDTTDTANDTTDAATDAATDTTDTTDTATDTTDAATDTTDTAPPRDEWLVGSGWTNVPFAPRRDETVTFRFDVRARARNINGVAGITLSRARAYSDVAMIVRMNELGNIDARDGADYAADRALPYLPDTIYTVVFEANLRRATYDVFVTPEGGSPITVRRGASFRADRVVDEVDHLTFYEPADQMDVGNLFIDGEAIPMDTVAPPDALYAVDFESSPLGNYTDDEIREDWPGTRWANPNDRVTVREEGGNRFLRVDYPRGGVGPGEGGAQWRVDFMGALGRTFDELYVSYRIRFRDGFDFVRGGKLPGLLGGVGNTGGDRPDGTDGWSGRMMWRRLGAAVQYLYHPDQPSIYGEDLPWSEGGERRFPTNRWITVTHRIVMNTPGARDGIVQGWFDGTLALDRRDIRFRDVDSFAIDGFYFSTFFGGSGSEWAPSRDETIDFDDFVFSEDPL